MTPDLPTWRAWLLTLMTRAFARWPFREPGRLATYRKLVQG